MPKNERTKKKNVANPLWHSSFHPWWKKSVGKSTQYNLASVKRWQLESDDDKVESLWCFLGDTLLLLRTHVIYGSDFRFHLSRLRCFGNKVSRSSEEARWETYRTFVWIALLLEWFSVLEIFFLIFISFQLNWHYLSLFFYIPNKFDWNNDLKL